MDLELNIECVKQSLCKAIIDESAVQSHISRETSGLGHKKSGADVWRFALLRANCAVFRD